MPPTACTAIGPAAAAEPAGYLRHPRARITTGKHEVFRRPCNSLANPRWPRKTCDLARVPSIRGMTGITSTVNRIVQMSCTKPIPSTFRSESDETKTAETQPAAAAREETTSLPRRSAITLPDSALQALTPSRLGGNLLDLLALSCITGRIRQSHQSRARSSPH